LQKKIFRTGIIKMLVYLIEFKCVMFGDHGLQHTLGIPGLPTMPNILQFIA